MANPGAASNEVDEYIAAFPADVQEILQKVRETVHQAAPEAEEAMRYRMPTLILRGNLVHFAGYKHHIGFYPTPSGIEQFQTELSPYASSKGAVQFPLDQPIPYSLIREITLFRVKETAEKEAAKGKKTPRAKQAD